VSPAIIAAWLSFIYQHWAHVFLARKEVFRRLIIARHDGSAKAVNWNRKFVSMRGRQKMQGGNLMPQDDKFVSIGNRKRQAKNAPGKKSEEKRVGVTVEQPTRGKQTAPAIRKVSSKSTQPVQPISERFPALEEQEVEIKFFAPEAKVVQIAGTFNGWRPEETQLEHTDSGEWIARLMLKSGQYEYRYVVDGVWTNDPASPQSTPNPYGERNSVLKVGLDDRTDLL
jgi:Glycogen recognition site of AMP-activated protein kinase